MAREREAKKREENEVEFSRIVAFSDGVFSIAITLLVLSLTIDSHLSEGELSEALWAQRENLLAYAISFAVIGRFWLVHHRFFGEVRAFDSRLIALNMFYLGWIVLIPFSSQVLGDYGGQTPSVVLYSVNLAGVVLVGLLMVADAQRAGLTTIGAESQRENLIRSSWIAGVFLLSIPVAYADAHIVPYMWLVLFLDPTERINRRLAPETPPRDREPRS
jgi:uncharacterized membrane protein